MFRHSKEIAKAIAENIKIIYTFFKFCSLILTTIYFIVTIILKMGNLIANIILAISFVFYTIYELYIKNKTNKQTKKVVKRSYKWLKIVVKAFALAATIYGIYAATTNVTPFSIILVIIMVIFWILKVIFEIIIEIFEDKISSFVTEVKNDVKSIFDKSNEYKEIDEKQENF